MVLLNAFIARSFAPHDEERIRPILDFLETFRKVGFICESADQAEVESVSKKVQGKIAEKEVLIAFFTKRYPVYDMECTDFKSRMRFAYELLVGRVKPRFWSAPPWVLQESGYALRANKDLILLRERGVEVFGLQGDLEYIEFDAENPAEVYAKLNEMIHGLLAKASGSEVKLIVADRQEEKSSLPAESVAIERTADRPKGDTEPNILIHFQEMILAQETGDFAALNHARDAGKLLIEAGKTTMDLVGWDSLYFEI